MHKTSLCYPSQTISWTLPSEALILINPYQVDIIWEIRVSRFPSGHPREQISHDPSIQSHPVPSSPILVLIQSHRLDSIAYLPDHTWPILNLLHIQARPAGHGGLRRQKEGVHIVFHLDGICCYSVRSQCFQPGTPSSSYLQPPKPLGIE